MKKLMMVIVVLTMVLSCSLALAAPYSDDQNTRHVEICIDLTQAWYNASDAGASQKANHIFKVLDKYNNHLVSDNDAIKVIEKAKQ